MVVDEFLRYLEYEKRYSKHTITSYKKDLEQFSHFCSLNFELSDFLLVSDTIIRSWVVSLIETDIESSSIQRKVSTLKSFYRYCRQQNYLDVNPAATITLPKKKKRLPVFVEEKGMDGLFANIQFPEDYDGVRDKLILEMFYQTGIRLSELINLKTSDVDLYNNTVRVLGKRNKERIVPFSLGLHLLIEDYVKVKNKLPVNESNTLFVTEKGVKLYPKLVYNTVKNYLSLITSITKKSPHILRHTFATHMLNNGADLNSIKELLGHTSLSATQVYTHNSFEKLKSIYNQAHPRA